MLAIGPFAIAGNDPDPSPGKRFEREVVGKKSLLGTVAGTGIQQARDSPYEWGPGWGGFGKRLASTFGKTLVTSGIQVTVGTILHEELTYRPSGKKGFRPRLKYALLRTVIVPKTTTGKNTFSGGEVSGAVGGGFISRIWQPARLHTFASGAGSAGIALGVDAGFNVAREFWPEIRHPKQAKARKDH